MSLSGKSAKSARGSRIEYDCDPLVILKLKESVRIECIRF